MPFQRANSILNVIIMGLSITILRLLTALLLLAGASLGQSPDELPSNPSNARPSCLDLGAGASNYAVNGLPNVKFSFPASWAGQIPVPNTANDDLFFWLFDAEAQCENLTSK